MSVSVLVDHTKELMATLEKLAKVGSIFVGVPEEKASRKSSEMNNATLAAIHELGSPAANTAWSARAPNCCRSSSG